MEEFQNELTQSLVDEPNEFDNSIQEQNKSANPDSDEIEGQSQDPSENLIIGKFKNVDELAKAYSELQKFQGQSSQELGELRKESSSVHQLKGSLETLIGMKDSFLETINSTREKYNQPEYFQDANFRELYKEAFMALEGNLDSDKFISLLESYVKSRVAGYEKSKAANAETQSVINTMTYSKGSKQTFTPPKKSLDEMTPKEIEDLIDRLI